MSRKTSASDDLIGLIAIQERTILDGRPISKGERNFLLKLGKQLYGYFIFDGNNDNLRGNTNLKNHKIRIGYDSSREFLPSRKYRSITIEPYCYSDRLKMRDGKTGQRKLEFLANNGRNVELNYKNTRVTVCYENTDKYLKNLMSFMKPNQGSYLNVHPHSKLTYLDIHPHS